MISSTKANRILKLFLIINLINFQIEKQNSLGICPVKNSSSYLCLLIDGFERFDQLNFSLCTMPIPGILLEIRPEKNLILDNSFNLAGLMVRPLRFFSINFLNLNGIDIKANPTNNLIFADFNFNLKNVIIVIDRSYFNFFYDSKLLDSSYCHPKKFPSLDRTFMNSISFLILTPSTSFPIEKLCPLLFSNVNLKLLSIAGMMTTLLVKNTFAFQTLFDRENKTNINSEIFQCILTVYRDDLIANVLDRLVFKRLKSLDINGELNFIQNDLFKSFKELKMLRFRSQNIKKLFSRQNEWLNYLNYDVNLENIYDIKNNHDKILFLVLFQTYSNFSYYEYPDKDFCYFKDFPHQRLVFPQLRPVSNLNCTCTELFLTQKSFQYSSDFHYYDSQLIVDYNLPPHSYDNEISDLRFSICSKENFVKLIDKCKFNKLLDRCNLISCKYIFKIFVNFMSISIQ